MALLEEITADSPVVLYKMLETSGSLTDSVGGRTMSLVSTAPTYAQAGIVHGDRSLYRSIQFNGSGYFTTPDHATWDAQTGATGQMTAEMVVQPADLSVSRWIFTKGDNPYEFGFSTSASGQVVFSTWTGGGATVMGVTSPALAVVGSPMHIIGTYSWPANQMRVYVNGVLTSGVYTGSAGNIANSSSTVQIARRGDGAGSMWNGKIGVIAYYSTALSDARCMAHWRAFSRGGVTY